MIHQIVAIHDRALDAFMRPFAVPTTGAAIRSFQDELNRTDSELNRHPEDYDLYLLATYDDSNGIFSQGKKPEKIADGKQLAITKQ